MPERKRKIVFAFAADCRARLDPPIPANYFGNCVKGLPIFTDAEALLGDDGVAFAAEKLSERIKGLEKGVISEREKERLAIYLEVMGPGATAIGIGVAGLGHLDSRFMGQILGGESQRRWKLHP